MAGTNDERFRGIRLYGERYKVAFPQGHRFNDMTSIRLTDLAEERLVARPNCAVISALRHACRDRDVVLEPEMTSENEFWSQAVVAAGLGVMLISETTPVAAGIATRPLADLALQRDVNLVSVAGRYVAPAVARFIRAAQNHVWTYSTTAA
jgi:DNA-binding transcriptional LysR family regulator